MLPVSVLVVFQGWGNVDSSGHVAEWRWEYTIHVRILSEIILLHSKQQIFSLWHDAVSLGNWFPKSWKNTLFSSSRVQW